MKYSLGLDIGVTSIGWAVIDEEGKRIERMGVRLFDEAENPKNGKSLAEPRRLARSARRRLRRRRGRLDALITLFTGSKMLSMAEVRSLQQVPQDPVAIRARGLDEKLTPQDLFVALFHIAKRRGYQSNRKKAKSEDKETGALLSSANANHERLAKYRTVGEMLAKDSFFGAGKQTRNKKVSEDAKKPEEVAGGYKCTVLREDLRSEVSMLLAQQRKFDAALPINFEKNISDVIFFQRPFAKAGDIEEKVGRCEFLKTERRAAKFSYTNELSRLYQNLNNLSILDEVGDKYRLTRQQVSAVVAFAHTHASVTYKQVRKELGLPQEHKFCGLLYKDNKDPEIAAGKQKFSLPGFYEVRKAIEGVSVAEWEGLYADRDTLDEVAEVLSLYKTDEEIREQLLKAGVSDAVCAALEGVSFSGFGHLSLAALRRLQPHLEEGKTYSEACEAEDFRPGKSATRTAFLKGLDTTDSTLTNPVMKRAVSQTIKVINAIVREYGAPHFVKIECAHDLSRNHADRKKIHKKQEDNRTANEQHIEQVKELGVANPKGHDIVKLRLYREQQCKCAYTLVPLDEQRVFTDADYTEVDHIIPYSRSGDDRNLNKVLVISGANRDKLDRTPYEWFGADEERWKTFEAYVHSCATMHPRKQELLITRKYTANGEWTSRALNDTRYITRFLSSYINDGLEFAPGKEKHRVIISNGSITAYLRRRWRIEKDREVGHLHHAADAAVVATITPALIQQVALFEKASEIRPYLRGKAVLEKSENYAPEAVKLAQQMITSHEARASDFFPKPWNGFDDELREKVKKVFVSFAPKRKVSGMANKATLWSPSKEKREKEKGKKSEAGFLVNDGKTFVENGSMTCLDIFEREVKGKKKYFGVPIYTHQTTKKAADEGLPSKILPPKAGFSEVDETFNFCFRLFPRDLLRIKGKDGSEVFRYYVSYDIDGCRIEVEIPEGNKIEEGKKAERNPRISIHEIPLLEKCVVDPLGKVSVVHKETRLDFSQKKK